MLNRKSTRLVAIASACSLLFLLSCSIEEDLRINGDGSGTYRVRLAVPKELGDFDKLRGEVKEEGFQVEEEGETEQERFIVFRKNFTEISSLNDSHHSFELTTTDIGIMRRGYRLRANFRALGFGSYVRRFVVSMPGDVQSATAGRIAGNRVTWEDFRQGTIEIEASGLYLPVSRSQWLFGLAAALAALLLFVAAHRRRQPVPAAAASCPSCHSPLANDARFCRVCGAGAPVTET
jgi:hypothetical protein